MKFGIIFLFYVIFELCLCKTDKKWNLKFFPNFGDTIYLFPGKFTQISLILTNEDTKPFSNNNLEYNLTIEDKNIISLNNSIILNPNENQYYSIYLGIKCENSFDKEKEIDYSINISVTPNNAEIDENSIIYENINVIINTIRDDDEYQDISFESAFDFMSKYSNNFFLLEKELFNIEEIRIQPSNEYFNFTEIVIKPYGQRQKIGREDSVNNAVLFDFPFKIKDDNTFQRLKNENIHDIEINFENNLGKCFKFNTLYISDFNVTETKKANEKLKKLIKAYFEDITEECGASNEIKIKSKVDKAPYLITCNLQNKYFFPEEYMEILPNNANLIYKNVISVNNEGNFELEIRNLEYNSEYILNCEISDANYDENNRTKINITIGNNKEADIVHILKTSREKSRTPQCIKFTFNKNDIDDFKMFGSKHCLYFMKSLEPISIKALPTLICEITEADEETVNLCVSPSPLYNVEDHVSDLNFSRDFGEFIEYVKNNYNAISATERVSDIKFNDNSISAKLVEDENKLTFEVLSTHENKVQCFYNKILTNESSQFSDYNWSIILTPNEKENISIQLNHDVSDYSIYSLHFKCYNLPNFIYKYESTGYMTLYSYLYLDLKNKEINKKDELIEPKHYLNCNEKKNQINPICLNSKKVSLNKIIKTEFPKYVQEINNNVELFSKLSDDAKYVFLSNFTYKYLNLKNVRLIFLSSIELLKYLSKMDCQKFSSDSTNDEKKTIKSEKYIKCRNIKQESMNNIFNYIGLVDSNTISGILDLNLLSDDKEETLKYILILLKELTNNEDSYKKNSESVFLNSFKLEKEFNEYWLKMSQYLLKNDELKEYIDKLQKEILLSNIEILTSLPRIIHFHEIDDYIDKSKYKITKSGLILYDKSIEIQELFINSTKRINESEAIKYDFSGYTFLEYSKKISSNNQKLFYLNNDIIIILPEPLLNRYNATYVKIFAFDSPLVSIYSKEKLDKSVESNTLNTFIKINIFNDKWEEINPEKLQEKYRPKISYLLDTYNFLEACYYYNSSSHLLQNDGMSVNKNITYGTKNYFECSADHLGIFTAGTADVNDDETEIIKKNNKSKNVKIILISLGIVLVLTIIISLLLEWRKKKRINSGRISDFGELML